MEAGSSRPREIPRVLELVDRAIERAGRTSVLVNTRAVALMAPASSTKPRRSLPQRRSPTPRIRAWPFIWPGPTRNKARRRKPGRRLPRPKNKDSSGKRSVPCNAASLTAYAARSQRMSRPHQSRLKRSTCVIASQLTKFGGSCYSSGRTPGIGLLVHAATSCALLQFRWRCAIHGGEVSHHVPNEGGRIRQSSTRKLARARFMAATHLAGLVTSHSAVCSFRTAEWQQSAWPRMARGVRE